MMFTVIKHASHDRHLQLFVLIWEMVPFWNRSPIFCNCSILWATTAVKHVGSLLSTVYVAPSSRFFTYYCWNMGNVEGDLMIYAASSDSCMQLFWHIVTSILTSKSLECFLCFINFFIILAGSSVLCLSLDLFSGFSTLGRWHHRKYFSSFPYTVDGVEFTIRSESSLSHSCFPFHPLCSPFSW